MVDGFIPDNTGTMVLSIMWLHDGESLRLHHLHPVRGKREEKGTHPLLKSLGWEMEHATSHIPLARTQSYGHL